MSTIAERLIHVKFEYTEGVRSKKDVLSLELNLLRTVKVIKRYQSIRLEELRLKAKAHKKIREFLSCIKKIQQTTPKIKIPDIIKKEEFEQIEESKEGNRTYKNLSRENAYSRDIESQLREIQDKLKSLG